MHGWVAAAFAVAAFGASAADEVRSLEVGDEKIVYLLRSHGPSAHLYDASAALAPDTPLNTSKLLNRHLSAGSIEEASLLSNAPKRRFEVLRDYRESIGEDEFKRVFTRYFFPENRLLAEVVIAPHALLIWRLNDESHLAGQYYVRIENRWLMDDVPSETRTKLRRVLESFRTEARVKPAK